MIAEKEVQELPSQLGSCRRSPELAEAQLRSPELAEAQLRLPELAEAQLRSPELAEALGSNNVGPGWYIKLHRKRDGGANDWAIHAEEGGG